MIPWSFVRLVGWLALRFGYDTNVLAQGGPGLHRGRFGADRLYFVRRQEGITYRKLKPYAYGAALVLRELAIITSAVIAFLFALLVIALLCVVCIGR